MNPICLSAMQAEHAQRRPIRRRRRARRVVVAVVALGCALAFAGPASARGQSPAPRATTAAVDAETQARDAERDEAVAAALVAALEQELGGRRIRLRLEPARVGIASVRDRVVEGRGDVSIGEGDEWLGLRYRVLYDAMMGTTGYPELHIGGMETGGRVLPNDATLVSALDDRVLDLLAEEFGRQQARMQLDRIVTVETGSRYLRIDAEGLVDFGRDGTAPVRVEGLYDRADGTWLRVAYALEPSADAGRTAASAADGSGGGSGGGAVAPGAQDAPWPALRPVSPTAAPTAAQPGSRPGAPPAAEPVPPPTPAPRAPADGG